MRTDEQIEKDKAITLIEKYIIKLESENATLREAVELLRIWYVDEGDDLTRVNAIIGDDAPSSKTVWKFALVALKGGDDE